LLGLQYSSKPKSNQHTPLCQSGCLNSTSKMSTSLHDSAFSRLLLLHDDLCYGINRSLTATTINLQGNRHIPAISVLALILVLTRDLVTTFRSIFVAIFGVGRFNDCGLS